MHACVNMWRGRADALTRQITCRTCSPQPQPHLLSADHTVLQQHLIYSPENPLGAMHTTSPQQRVGSCCSAFSGPLAAHHGEAVPWRQPRRTVCLMIDNWQPMRGMPWTTVAFSSRIGMQEPGWYWRPRAEVVPRDPAAQTSQHWPEHGAHVPGVSWIHRLVLHNACIHLHRTHQIPALSVTCVPNMTQN